VEKDGIRLTYSTALDEDSAGDPGNWKLRHWNYRWTPGYGSPKLKPSDGENGTEPLPVQTATVSADGRTVKLGIPGLKPVHQVWVQPDVKRSDGTPLKDQIYLTINKVPR